MYRLERTSNGVVTILLKSSSQQPLIFDSYETAKAFASKMNSHLLKHSSRWEVIPYH
ncbi:hypothetical protein ACE1TH_19030 [Shouchella sp. JSM 1781072]|uniref:hypothetical protein n=1 Tax=Bacillaceae TaxID=186817 RepID=UPI00159BE2F7|nr:MULTISPECIES: hypothetical protein [Bacillaceae]UTR07525.1 hypothetical protein MM326_05710 [Alkalihalobacillus sp. LMS6]